MDPSAPIGCPGLDLSSIGYHRLGSEPLLSLGDQLGFAICHFRRLARVAVRVKAVG